MRCAIGVLLLVCMVGVRGASLAHDVASDQTVDMFMAGLARLREFEAEPREVVHHANAAPCNDDWCRDGPLHDIPLQCAVPSRSCPF